MAIEKYVTRAIILDVYDQGEHDRAYKAFTRDFGLIICHAKSIRKLESKLRPHVLPRSVTTLTLVKGREVWRIVGAEKENRDCSFVHETTLLLGRFIRGEGAHKNLYDKVDAFLHSKDGFEERYARLLLYYILLVELGYVDIEVAHIEGVAAYKKMTLPELYTHIILSEQHVRRHINDVLKEMQL